MSKTSLPLTAAELVVMARTRMSETQTDFAHRVGKSQTLVSKYETGVIDVPGPVLMQCLHILQVDVGRSADVSVKELTSLLSKVLGKPEKAAERQLMARLLRTLR